MIYRVLEVVSVIHSVSDLTKFIKNMFQYEPILQNVMVRGEISNLKTYTSGHVYFTLKDKNAALKCVMFKSRASTLIFRPENGMQVIADGHVSVYETAGVYQLYVDRLIPDGAGALSLAYEQLKAKLSEEGLFDDEYKKELPRFPKTIGIVTSPSGAVLHDIHHVSKRRDPNIKLVLYPVKVQGDGAAEEIAHAIEFFNEKYPVDVLIVGRGGGSIEDLWAFNEEIVARAIFASKIPVISAVGHETDFTLADFTADVRAATPSQAAELAVPNREELLSLVSGLESRLISSKNYFLRSERGRLIDVIERFMRQSPQKLLADNRQHVDDLALRLKASSSRLLTNKKTNLDTAMDKLELLNPIRVLRRGYSIVYAEDGSILRRINQVKSDETITVMLADGKFKAQIVNVGEEA